MSLNQILRRIRRQPAEPELSLEMRAWAAERNKHLHGLTAEDIDEIQRRAVAGRDEEIRHALAESDAEMTRRREKRNPG